MEKSNEVNFLDDEHGAVLIETLIIVPFLVILTFGILEFGNVMWQRQQLQVGVRDAARYWSRCRPAYMNCSQTMARDIAFTGIPIAGGTSRVPGWNAAEELTILPNDPQSARADIVTVDGAVEYTSSAAFAALFGSKFTLSHSQAARYIGW